MPFGQVVLGPPGSGKSTYCHGLQQFLGSLQRRPVLVNLDPANENLPYACDVDVRDLVRLEDVMAGEGLGPNGALLRCMEEVEANVEWLLGRVEACGGEGYFVFDLPGQAELFTCHGSLLQIVRRLQQRAFRLVAVHLVDAAYCSEPARFLSILTLALQSMMQLECPHINVLSKLDLVEAYGPLALGLAYYADVQDLHHLLVRLDGERFGARFHALSRALVELVEDYSVLSFVPLAVQDKDCMAFLLAEADKANGCVFGGLVAGNESIMAAANTADRRAALIELVEDRYIGGAPET